MDAKFSEINQYFLLLYRFLVFWFVGNETAAEETQVEKPFFFFNWTFLEYWIIQKFSPFQYSYHFLGPWPGIISLSLNVSGYEKSWISCKQLVLRPLKFHFLAYKMTFVTSETNLCGGVSKKNTYFYSENRLPIISLPTGDVRGRRSPFNP